MQEQRSGKFSHDYSDCSLSLNIRAFKSDHDIWKMDLVFPKFPIRDC